MAWARRRASRCERLATMTEYQHGLALPGRVRRRAPRPTRSAAVLARAGADQLHVAETEKYAHVTYFFNGGEERSVCPASAASWSRPSATCPPTTSSRR